MKPEVSYWIWRFVEGKALQAGELFAPGLLHARAEDVLPGVQLQELDATEQFIGLLQPLAGIFLSTDT